MALGVLRMLDVLRLFYAFHVLGVFHMLDRANPSCVVSSHRFLDLGVADMISAPCSVAFGNKLGTHFSR